MCRPHGWENTANQSRQEYQINAPTAAHTKGDPFTRNQWPTIFHISGSLSRLSQWEKERRGGEGGGKGSGCSSIVHGPG